MKRFIALCAASGVGKSTTVERLNETPLSDNFLFCDNDNLGLNWHDFKDLEDGGHRYHEIGFDRAVEMSGDKDIVMATSFNPDSLDKLTMNKAITQILFLNLVCSDEVLAKRLKGRPVERGTHTDEFIATQVDFMNYFRRSTHLLDKVIDTSDQTAEETACAVAEYLESIS